MTSDKVKLMRKRVNRLRNSVQPAITLEQRYAAHIENHFFITKRLIRRVMEQPLVELEARLATLEARVQALYREVGSLCEGMDEVGKAIERHFTDKEAGGPAPASGPDDTTSRMTAWYAAIEQVGRPAPASGQPREGGR